jgi:hypothetical protein
MTTTSTTNTNTNKTKPVAKVRLGSVVAAIWQQVSSEGRVWYSASVERSYFDEKEGKWKSSNSFSRDEMLLLGKVSSLANTRIYELQSRDRNEASHEELPDVPANAIYDADGVEVA